MAKWALLGKLSAAFTRSLYHVQLQDSPFWKHLFYGKFHEKWVVLRCFVFCAFCGDPGTGRWRKLGKWVCYSGPRRATVACRLSFWTPEMQRCAAMTTNIYKSWLSLSVHKKIWLSWYNTSGRFFPVLPGAPHSTDLAVQAIRGS